MVNAKHIIENIFSQLASAQADEDSEKLALSGDIMNHRPGKKYPDPRGMEYGHYEVTTITGGKRVTWFAGEEYVDAPEPLYGYTCYVPDEDWDVFEAQHVIS
jgi:hypothetical protein